MKLYHSTQLTGDEQKALCIRPWTAESSARSSVEALCLDVKKRGDAALREYSKRFDAAEVIDVKVNPSSIEAGQKAVPPFVLAAIDQAARNIRAFHASQIRKEEELETEIGVVCWREQRALETVGLYVPAGSAPLPSTVLMLGIPALLAGCKRIILCSPPKANGLPDPVVLAAAAQIGLREVYAIEERRPSLPWHSELSRCREWTRFSVREINMSPRQSGLSHPTPTVPRSICSPALPSC